MEVSYARARVKNYKGKGSFKGENMGDGMEYSYNNLQILTLGY